MIVDLAICRTESFLGFPQLLELGEFLFSICSAPELAIQLRQPVAGTRVERIEPNGIQEVLQSLIKLVERHQDLPQPNLRFRLIGVQLCGTLIMPKGAISIAVQAEEGSEPAFRFRIRGIRSHCGLEFLLGILTGLVGGGLLQNRFS